MAKNNKTDQEMMSAWLKPCAPVLPSAEASRAMRYNHRGLHDSNGNGIHAGSYIRFKIDGEDEIAGVVSFDPVFRGGLRCGEMSVLWLLDEAEYVFLV